MDWDKLRIFDVVAEHGTLTKAGQALGMSQSAVSRQIATLEDSLGFPLFRRHARGLTLTEQGALLRETTRDVERSLSLIKGKLTDTKSLAEGPLTVTVSEFLASTWLAPRLALFREQYPLIRLNVMVDDRVLSISSHEVDVALRLYRPRGAGLVQRHLGSIRFHMYASRDYLKHHGHPKTPADLADHFLIAFPENIPGPFDKSGWLFEFAGVDEKKSGKILMINSMYAIYSAVKAGAGIAVIPDYLGKADPQLEVVLRDCMRPDVDVYFVYAEERKNSRRINAFRDFILEQASQSGIG